jgi:hypothetical protein
MLREPFANRGLFFIYRTIRSYQSWAQVGSAGLIRDQRYRTDHDDGMPILCPVY